MAPPIVENIRVIFKGGSTPGFDFCIRSLGNNKYRLDRTGFCEVGIMNDISNDSVIAVMPKWKKDPITNITRNV